MEKNRIKFEFLVHDLKVPLAVIEAGILSLLQKQDKYGELNDKQIKILERALRNTIVTRTLVNDALEIGRSSQGIINKSTFTPCQLVEETLIEVLDLTDHTTADAVKERKTLADLKACLAAQGLILEIDDAFWNRDLYLDESKVRQIFRNLLINAMKYKKNRVTLKLERGERHIFISVSDDGEGIPSGYHKKIFECYFQMDMKTDHCVRGHGLGLAGVQVLLEDMGGELSLESDTGKGATFSVKIPW
ncbi:MAG TPA: HAMP domain-containing sensor histidine kinase [Desulfatiglandales bacterium]|nr:HAMP domain-containing sensor histidine kinase [Desulfatiglandales bacterium]